MTKTQSDKFKESAKEHGADEDEKRWEERLRKVVKPKLGSADDDAPQP